MLKAHLARNCLHILTLRKFTLVGDNNVIMTAVVDTRENTDDNTHRIHFYETVLLPLREYEMRLLTLIATIGILIASTFGAAAHGPTRQKVVLSVTLDASPDEVWAAIGGFHDMSWHPVVFSTAGEGDNDIDSIRVLTLAEENGPTLTEQLYKYSAEKRSYSYRITDVLVSVLPVTNYSSTITVKDVDGKALVEWKGAFYRGEPKNNPPENLSDEAAVAAVTGVYNAGLDALKEKFGSAE